MISLKDRFGKKNIDYIISSERSIEDAIKESDMVIGAVYVIGKQAPKVIKKTHAEVDEAWNCYG